MIKLTFDEAYKLHVEMWQAMRDELGDCPEADKRITFKRTYLQTHGYVDKYGLSKICNNCFLCQYTGGKCSICPVVWPNKSACCLPVYDRYGLRSDYYLVAPISEILALPVREKRPDDL